MTTRRANRRRSRAAEEAPPNGESVRTASLGPAVLALAALLGLVVTLDPAGSLPGLAAGPGVTVDESFNVQQGVRLVLLVPEWLRGRFTLREVFGEAEDLGPNPPAGYHLPDHPPLGRLWLGVFHQLGLVLLNPVRPEGPFVTVAARLGSAVAFAGTVFLVGWYAARRYGWRGGTVAAAAVILMPRLWGHAHLAALETVLNLVWTAAVLAIARWWRDEDGVRPRAAIWAGVVFGLLLLTKIQAILLPIPVAAWAVWRWRTRAIVPLALWGGTGFAVFLAGWPWLWLDPPGHLAEYVGSATERATLYVTYFGQRYADRAVPWHYPFATFLFTVPVGLHALGVLGLRNRSAAGGRVRTEENPRNVPSDRAGGFAWEERLLLSATLFPLLVFAVPGVAVYDGARLFLIAFPPWAILIGRGAAIACEWLDDRWNAARSTIAVFLVVAVQAVGLVRLAPAHLSYYNLLVGGLGGAERLGLQTTYWGDSITRPLLTTLAEDVPRGAVVDLAPSLHRFHADEIVTQSPILRRKDVALRGYDPDRGDARYLLLFDRRADWPNGLDERLADARLIASVTRSGVRLAAAYELPP